MKHISEFRRFYNKIIHPELLLLERQRKRLIRLFFFSVILFIVFIGIVFYINMPAISLFGLIPLSLYSSYLIYKIQQFRASFKPTIVNLLLAFIGDNLSYDHKGIIPKQTFKASGIFVSDAPYYEGEDYIRGQIGSIDFELCELNVREMSPVRNRLNYVFRGIFFHARFKEFSKGKTVILPRLFKQYLSRTIKQITKEKGSPVRTHHNSFDDTFMVYATHIGDASNLLSDEMLDTIIEYKERAEKEIYLSFVHDNIYIAMTEHKDILEPNIIRSNVNFKLVENFFKDLYLILSIVEDFDRHH